MINKSGESPSPNQKQLYNGILNGELDFANDGSNNLDELDFYNNLN